MKNQKTIKILGAICIAYALLFIFSGIWEIAQPSFSYADGFAVLSPAHLRAKLLIWAFPGFFAGHLGYYLSGAAGKNWFSRAIIVVSALGHALIFYDRMYSFATFGNDTFVGVWGLLLGQWLPTFLIGVAALFAKKAPLWKRIFPVWLAVAPQFFFPVYILVFGLSPFYALATVGINWVIFGWIVYSLAETDSRKTETAGKEFSNGENFLSVFEKI